MRTLASLALALFLLTSCSDTPAQSQRGPIPAPSLVQASPLDKMAQIRKNERWEHFRRCPDNNKAMAPQQLVLCPTDIFVAKIHNGEFLVTRPVEGVTIRLTQLENPLKVRLDYVVQEAKVYGSFLNLGPGTDGKNVYVVYDSRYWETGFTKTVPLELIIIVSHPKKTSYVEVPKDVSEAIKNLKLWPYFD